MPFRDLCPAVLSAIVLFTLIELCMKLMKRSMGRCSPCRSVRSRPVPTIRMRRRSGATPTRSSWRITRMPRHVSRSGTTGPGGARGVSRPHRRAGEAWFSVSPASGVGNGRDYQYVTVTARAIRAASRTGYLYLKSAGGEDRRDGNAVRRAASRSRIR